MRSGTLPTPLVVGLGEACRVANQELERDLEHAKRLSDRLWQGLTSQLDEIVLNGDREKRYPGNMNVSFAFVEGESLLMALSGIAISSGSACTSASLVSSTPQPNILLSCSLSSPFLSFFFLSQHKHTQLSPADALLACLFSSTPSCCTFFPSLSGAFSPLSAAA